MCVTIMRVLTSCLLLAIASFGCFAQANGKEQAVEIPFEFHKNEIILQVRVNGKGPFNMMLDTGTDPSGVDVTTAKDLGLKLHPLGKEISGGGTDSNRGYYTQLPLIEVGAFTAKNVDAIAIDLSKVSERLGKPLHGVLGHSVLNGRIVQIDYPGRVLRFYTRSPFSKSTEQANTSKRTVIAFRYADNVLIDDVSVNGKKIVGNLDTGSSGLFNLTPAAVSYLGLEEEVGRAPVSTDVGFNGVSENRKGKLRNVTIGGISLDEPDVIFFGKGTGRDKKPWGLNIGNVFLKDFVMTIDYKKKLIALERP
jgi:predicted aspartyl protease